LRPVKIVITKIGNEHCLLILFCIVYHAAK
jgi:hypothetical protein